MALRRGSLLAGAVASLLLFVITKCMSTSFMTVFLNTVRYVRHLYFFNKPVTNDMVRSMNYCPKSTVFCCLLVAFRGLACPK